LKFKQPVSGILLNGDGTFKAKSNEGMSLWLFIQVAFKTPKEAFGDHSISKYIDEISKIS
jgi:hypothetical protein